MEGLNRAIDVQKAVGALSGDIDVTKMIDTQYLPDDIKSFR
jgi:NitT/TauT family transport system substrate-binding protein